MNTPIVPDDPTREVVTTQGYLDKLHTALAQAERERAIQHTCTHCGYVAATQYGEELRAEVERLKATLSLMSEERLVHTAKLTRVRRALEDYLAPHESGSHPGGGGDPDAAARLQRLKDERAALEGRG